METLEAIFVVTAMGPARVPEVSLPGRSRSTTCGLPWPDKMPQQADFEDFEFSMGSATMASLILSRARIKPPILSKVNPRKLPPSNVSQVELEWGSVIVSTRIIVNAS